MRVGDLLGAALRAAGISAVYGPPLPGVRVVPVADPAVAVLLAEAHTRVYGTPAGAHLGAGELLVGPTPGERRVVVEGADDVRDLPTALAAGAARVLIRVDLAAPVLAGAPPAAAVQREPAEPSPELVERVAAARRPVLVAGPGVIADRAVPGLHAVATAARLGVLNTWGAKGVFDWRSPHHVATTGLQRDDFTLGGLADADLVVGTGLDPDESPPGSWQLGADTVEVPPTALGTLAGHWRREEDGTAELPPLRPRLAAVTQRGWAAPGLAPSRVTRNYGRALPPGGLLAADPGTAGYWVARTFSTTQAATILVPGRPDAAGFAAAAVLVARLREPGRPALAVVDDPEDPAVRAVLAEAARLGVPVPVEAWRPEAQPLPPDAHLDRTRSLMLGDEPTTVTVGPDPSQLDDMVEAAGPVVAWGGLRP